MMLLQVNSERRPLPFLFLRTLPLALLATLTLQGCSLAFATSPPKDVEVLRNCTHSSALPIVDGVLAGAQLAGALLVLSLDKPPDSTGAEQDAAVLLGLGTAVLFAASAGYGSSVVDECRTYKRAHAELEDQRRQENELAMERHRRASRSDRSDEEDEEPEPAAPSGGAGFKFGDLLDATTANCAERGGVWAFSPSGYTCTWTRDQEQTRVSLAFCEGNVLDVRPHALCHIELHSAPKTEDGRVWGKAMSRLHSQLRRRFGHPEKRRFRYPAECQSPAHFYQCLVANKITVRQSWGWANGHTIVLKFGSFDEKGTPSVAVSFSTGDYVAPPAPEAVQAPAAAAPAATTAPAPAP